MIGRKNIMAETTLPIWSLDHHHHRQNQVQEDLFKGKEGNGSQTDHINHQQNFSQFAAMSEVAELTWENGQLAMHEFPTKPAWGGRTGDTLESIVHQATIFNNNIHFQNPNLSKQQQQQQRQQNMETVGSVVASCGEKCTENSRQVQVGGHQVLLTKRRERPTDYDHHYGRKVMASNSIHERKGDDGRTDRSACASAAVVKNNSDTTMMTWASLESPTKTTDDDSACQDGSENQEEERETRSETGRSSSARRGRAADVHNQSERRRRDRINQKMKALQKLVPNASKTDKASMLDEVIDYLKQLQAQVQMFNRYMPQPQFMLPLGMQQHIQMSLLARMGMGMGMLDMSKMACPAAIPQPMNTLVHPHPVANNINSTFGAATTPFLVPPVIPNPSMPNVTEKPINNPGISADPLQDPYNAMLAQSMNADLYSRMAALHRQQQINQNTQAASSIPQSNPAH